VVHTAPAQYRDATAATQRRWSQLRQSAGEDSRSLSHTRGRGTQHPVLDRCSNAFHTDTIGKFVLFDSHKGKAIDVGSLCRPAA
jgi:hypothetical protein